MRDVRYLLVRNSIVLSFYPIVGERLRWYVGEAIDPKQWDKRSQRIKAKNRYDQYLNDYLDAIAAFVMETRRIYRIKGELLTPNMLKKLLDQKYKKVISKEHVTFYDYVKMWLERKEGSVKHRTYNNYRTALNMIIEVNKDLSWDIFNKTWSELAVKRMKKYSRKSKKGRQAINGYKHNSIVKGLSVLRTLLRDAEIDGYHSNVKYKSRGFVPMYDEIDSVYMSIEFLEKMYNYDYDNDRIRNAVNLFLIGCYTGQRYQTFKNINQSMIYEKDGIKMISVVPEKTIKYTKQVSIPVSHVLDKILSEGVRPISDQKLRLYIKEAAKLNGFKQWEKVGTHTARRSFATNMLIAGVPKHLIMSITGHKTEREFNKYVKYTHIESAIKAAPWVHKVFDIRKAT